MKRISILVLVLVGMMSVVRVASASSIFSYTATAAPGATPDGVDQNGNPVDIWTVTLTPPASGTGGEGVYEGTAFSGETLSGWQEYSYPGAGGPGTSGSVDATNIFAGGALTVGQTVSINFEMRAADAHGTVGVSLLNGSGNAITFGIYGAEPDSSNTNYTGTGYYYSDAGSGGDVNAGSMGYQYQIEFNIAFTITGPNTYTAIAGSDSWSGTFSGSLIGIDVFNHDAGDASDTAFNNLTVQPELAINNIFPNDLKALFNATNTLHFTANSPGSPINSSGIQLILNGSNVSSHLVVNNSGTENVSVSYTNLLLNQNYVGQITVSNAAGVVATAPVAFDTFSTNYFTWEAEDFDFNGGQFINNPVLSTNSAESYYNTVGVSNIDEYVPNYSATQPHLWRTNDEVSTALAGDTPRAQFTATGIPDYLVGYFNPSNWVNYTRTFPAGTYNIYARLANGNGGLANCDLSEVVSGQDTTNQVTEALGIFQFTGLGWNDFSFVPLTDASGNMLAVKLNGQTTLRVTSGQLGGGVNMNFFMLAPGSNTPPAIVNTYPDGLEPFETTNALSFDVTSGTSTVSQNNVQVTLNGVNRSSQLVFSGTSTNWTVSLPLPQQGVYTGTITVTDAAGNSNSHNVSFDTFSQNNFMVNAVDYDFSGGQFIDNPIPTGNATASLAYTAPNSYYAWPEGNVGGNPAFTNIDYSTNVQAGFTADYRFLDQAGTQPATDFLLQNFIANGATEFNLAYWNPGQWFNYTRTYPTNQFYVYGRFAQAGPFSGVTLAQVTSGQSTTTQTTNILGSFASTASTGYQDWVWAPMMTNGQMAVISLGGVETLRLIGGTGQNANYLMFVAVNPAVNLTATTGGGNIVIQFPTQNGSSYTVYSSSSLTSGWAPVGAAISGTGSTVSVTNSMTQAQQYYRVLVQ